MQKKFLIFLAGLALLASLLGGVATSRYGSGVASDSVKYMAVAQSLLDGNGLRDHRGGPLLSWPPLYPIVLAGLSFLLHLDVFVIAGYFNIFLHSLNVFLSGLIFWRAFSARPLYAYLASVFVLLSISLLRVHNTIFSEPLYLTVSLGLLWVVNDYIRERSRRALLWMVLLSALAPILRYVGLAVGVTACLIILIENRKSLRIIFRDGLIVGLASILPIGWWLIIRNIGTYGTLFGTSGAPVDVYQNISLALTKILHWFVPYLAPLMPILTRPFFILLLTMIILYLMNLRRAEAWRGWVSAVADPVVYPSLIYGLVYFLAVVVTSITGDHKWLNQDDRYYVILFVPVMLLIWFTYDTLMRPHLSFLKKDSVMLLLIFVIWSVYPVYSLREYLLKAREFGESSEYNLFNTHAYHEAPVVAEMQRLRNDQPDALVYSNYSDAVWFYTRKNVIVPPIRDIADFDSVYAGWPNDKPGYLVWFKPNEYKHYLSPAELSQLANVSLVYSDESGDIYYVSAK